MPDLYGYFNNDHPTEFADDKKRVRLTVHS